MGTAPYALKVAKPRGAGATARRAISSTEPQERATLKPTATPPPPYAKLRPSGPYLITPLAGIIEWIDSFPEG